MQSMNNKVINTSYSVVCMYVCDGSDSTWIVSHRRTPTKKKAAINRLDSIEIIFDDTAFFSIHRWYSNSLNSPRSKRSKQSHDSCLAIEMVQNGHTHTHTTKSKTIPAGWKCRERTSSSWMILWTKIKWKNNLIRWVYWMSGEWLKLGCHSCMHYTNNYYYTISWNKGRSIILDLNAELNLIFTGWKCSFSRYLTCFKHAS